MIGRSERRENEVSFAERSYSIVFKCVLICSEWSYLGYLPCFFPFRTELCNFSGLKILPSRGKKYIRVDGKVPRFKRYTYCGFDYLDM